MKVRSKELWQFLEQSGALDGTPEQINDAKKAFRKQYQQNWRKTTKKSKELRPMFTRTEFEQISIRSKLFGLNPTSYARDLIISAQEHFELVPNKGVLLKILQNLSMAENAIRQETNIREASLLITLAENQLMQYLNIQIERGN